MKHLQLNGGNDVCEWHDPLKIWSIFFLQKPVVIEPYQFTFAIIIERNKFSTK
jgi:hypothetical protein